MRIRFYGCLLAFFALLPAAQPAHAQQATGTITGRVTDKESQAAVAGAVVEAVSASGRSVASALTDAAGQFRMSNVPAGTYAVVITMVGYETARIASVHVVSGETSMAGAALTTQAFLLNPVVVSASKHAEKLVDAPAAVSVVPEREIAERPTTTPVDHLRSTPGVDIMTTGVQGTNVVVRGFNNIFSGALHTLTDYRAANVPSLRVNFLQFLPQNNEDFSRIEVVLGPGSALYGPNTANGVLHFITKSPIDEPGTTLAVSGGQFPGAANDPGTSTMNGTLLQLEGRSAQKFSDKFGMKLSGQYLKAPEFFYRDKGEDSIRALVAPIATNDAALRASGLFPLTATDLQTRAARIGNRDFDIKRWGLDFRADYRPTENLSTVLSAGITDDNSIELTGIGAGQAVDWKYSYVQGRANYKGWFAQAYANMSDAGGTFLLRNGAPITDQSKLYAAQLQHVAHLGDKQTFTYGGDYIYTNPVTNGTINGTRENNDTYSEVGGYLQSETNLSKLFEVVLAGRVDKHSELDKAIFSPRAGLVFKPTPNQNFRVTYNRAFSTPTSLNLFLDIDAGALGALGPFGFRAHAQAPGREGIMLHDANGNVQIASPFSSSLTALTPSQFVSNPTTLNNVDLASIYNRQVSAVALASPLVGSNPQLVGFLRSLTPDTNLAEVGLVLRDPLTGKQLPFSNNGVSNVGGIKPSTDETYEVGWKGLIRDKLIVAVDAWHAKHTNFTSPLITATPFVMLNPQALAAYLVPKLMLLPGMTLDNAKLIAGGMAQLPGGIVSSAATTAPGPNLILTYINFGDLTLNGGDISATALLSSKWQFAVTGSLVSDDYFNMPLGTQTADSQVVALNAPKKKGSAALTYRDLTSGINAEVRVRYQDEFPANSAGYVGLSCVKSAPANSGPCVQAYTLLDLTAGYRLPVTGATVQLNVTNLFDEKYQSFIGTPQIRRMAILRVKYDLK